MYYRYRLCARYNNDIVFDHLFPSVNSAIKCASGLNLDCLYVSMFDDLNQSFFGHDFISRLVKEFKND